MTKDTSADNKTTERHCTHTRTHFRRQEIRELTGGGVGAGGLAHEQPHLALGRSRLLEGGPARAPPSLARLRVRFPVGRPAPRVALRPSRPRAGRSPYLPASRPGESVGGSGVAPCPVEATRSWDTRTNENFRRTAGASCASACSNGFFMAGEQKYQMPAYLRASS